MKRSLMLGLALLLCLSALVSCSLEGNEDTSSDSQKETQSQGVTGDDVEYDENGYQKDKLGQMDFNGQTIRISGWSEVENKYPEFGVEKLGAGTIVDDAAYLKNKSVETRLNVSLKFDTVKGWTGPGDGSGQEQLTRVQNAAGTGDIDLIGTYSWNACTFMVNGLVSNLNSMPYLDLNHPWWNESIVEKSSIYGNVYYATGDISPSYIGNTYAIFFNKNVAEEFKLGDIYALYDNDRWTMEKMIELSKMTASDTGVVGTKENTDKFGFVTYLTAMDALYQGSDFTLVDNAPDGSLLLSEDFTSAEVQSLIETLVSFNNTDACYIDEGVDYLKAWKQGNALFVLTDIYNVKDWENSNAKNFGLLPMPKYSEDQEDYHTLVGFYYSMYCVPRSSQGNEAVGATLECLASEAYRRVTPAYYESMIRTRFSATVKEAMMFDTVRDSVVIDSGRIFQGHLGWKIWGEFRSCIKNSSTDWISASGTLAPSIENKVTSLNQMAQILG